MNLFQHLVLSILLSNKHIFGKHNSGQNVDITPREAVKRIGDELTVICKVPYNIDSCRMTVGGTSYRLIPDNIDGDVIYAGQGLKSNGYYNVTLILSAIEKEDVDKTYLLRVSNDLGTELYSVKISNMAEPAVSEVLFSIEELQDHSLSCKQTREKPGQAIVLENDDMKLTVTFEGRKLKDSPGINYFQCVGKDKPNYVFLKNPAKFPRKSVTSMKATTQMSGLWECRILTNRGVGVAPVKYDSALKGNFTELFCYVNVHVRLIETPQTVLVNNMVLPTERMDYTEKDVDHSAMYNYLNGDIVTVACIPGSNILKNYIMNPYTIEFQYDYAEKLDDMFKLKNISNELGYGFHTKLQTQHNNTVMICKCSGQDDHTIIKVTFVLKQMIKSTGYITVNGFIARPLQSTKNNNDLNYLFFKDKNVEIVCKSNEDSVVAAGKQEECKTGGQTFTQQLKTPFEFNCILCGYVDGIVRDRINVITNDLASNFKEHNSLVVDLPSDKILIELFKYDETERHSWIYYEFEEDVEVELKCTAFRDENSATVMEVKYFFNKEEIKKNTRVTLSSEDDNKYFECLLVEAMDSRIPIPMVHKRITVLFRKRLLTTTPTTTTSTSTSIQIETQFSSLEIIGIVVGFLLAVLCAFCYWRLKKRAQVTTDKQLSRSAGDDYNGIIKEHNDQMESPKYEYIESNNDTHPDALNAAPEPPPRSALPSKDTRSQIAPRGGISHREMEQFTHSTNQGSGLKCTHVENEYDYVYGFKKKCQCVAPSNRGARKPL